METVEIDATGISTEDLNERLMALMLDGTEKFVLKNVCGQRYIGTRLYSKNGNKPRVDIDITGTPGSDLGAFMSGHRVRVHGNVQDGVGNTMDDGRERFLTSLAPAVSSGTPVCRQPQVFGARRASLPRTRSQ